MQNTTAIRTGSANQQPNTPCIRLWIDVTFRGLENSYVDLCPSPNVRTGQINHRSLPKVTRLCKGEKKAVQFAYCCIGMPFWDFYASTLIIIPDLPSMIYFVLPNLVYVHYLNHIPHIFNLNSVYRCTNVSPHDHTMYVGLVRIYIYM